MTCQRNVSHPFNHLDSDAVSKFVIACSQQYQLDLQLIVHLRLVNVHTRPLALCWLGMPG